MGMTCTLYRVPSTTIDELVANPAKVEEILYADNKNWTLTHPKGLIGFLLRFTPITIEAATRNEPLTPEEVERLSEIECDLEGAWHGLHFLFTGTAWEGDEPACYLIRGGEEVGGDDFDVPPRLLHPDKVRAFNDFLGGLSDDELQRRFDRRRMAELNIDPGALWQNPPASADPAIGLLVESFNELRVFTGRAVAAGDALIIHLA